MKRFCIIAILGLISIGLFAQEHLAIKGVPIDGKLSDFVSRLEQNGFTFAQNDAEGAYMRGVFTGKECTLYIEASPISKTVHTVFVLFNPLEDWATLKNDYATIKKGLILKYGEPKACKEEVRSPYKEGDGHAYMAFKGGYADWHSSFSAPQGAIDLYIRQQDWNELNVIVKYADKVNTKKSTDELTADL